jgi:proteasome accessory factor A
MAKEKLVPRIYGSEIEYSYTAHRPVGLEDEDGDYRNLFPAGTAHVGEYLGNGGRLYIDCDLIEYATPECADLPTLVKHELAGEQIIWDAYGNGRTGIETFHKRCMTPDGTLSSGAHENYSTEVDVWTVGKRDANIDALASHFSTRTSYIGAGLSTINDYVLGQKIRDTYEESGSNQVDKKSLVNTRAEHHNVDDNETTLHRLHVTCGDANMSPWALRMKFGTTSLVLRLLENEEDLSLLTLTSPLRMAYKASGGVKGMIAPQELKTGKTATALDIQEVLFERANKLSQRIELPQGEQEVLGEWITTIHALRRYAKTDEHQNELSQIDWYIKKQILQKRSEKVGILDRPEEERMDLVYDQLPDGVGIRLRKNGRIFASHMPSEGDIQKAKVVAPEGRAKMRGALIKKAYELEGEDAGDRFTVAWDSFEVPAGTSRDMPINVKYGDRKINKWLGELF